MTIKEVNGKKYTVEIVQDDSREPWKESDCYGEVIEWQTRDMLPHEWLLASRGGRRYYYDVAASRKKALDVWGVKPDDVEEALEADFKRLKAWFDDEWCFVGVIVRPSVEKAAMWGVESDYTEDVIAELIAELESR